VRVARQTSATTTHRFVFQLKAERQDEGDHEFDKRFAIAKQLKIRRFVLEIDGDSPVFAGLAGGVGHGSPSGQIVVGNSYAIKQACKRRPMGTSTTTPTRAAHPNHVWSYDFVHDETTDGRRLKCLTIIDEYTREGLEIACARSITATDVVQVLRRLFAQRGAPLYVKSDNGPEFIAQRVTTWLREQHVDTHFIDPGSPWQNGHNESFNRH
jgi:transposase InsO family protein